MKSPEIITAAASRRGIRGHNADAFAIHHFHGLTAAAVVDGIGSSPAVAQWSALAAQVAVRVGARKTSVLGILAAAELNADQGAASIDPDGVAVLAVGRPGHATSIAWTGDARAYSWDGHTLHHRSTDMNVGEYLRSNGFPLDATTAHDDWLRASLGRSSIATVHQAEIHHGLVLLTSDGVHKQCSHDHLSELVRARADAPQVLVDSIVAAVRPDAEGYLDDATAVVLLHRPASS